MGAKPYLTGLVVAYLSQSSALGPNVIGTAEDAELRSRLANFIKTRVRARLETIYSRPVPIATYLQFIDKKGGLGNQLMGLSSALIVAAATGRRLCLGSHSSSSIGNWVWRDYFKPPLTEWRCPAAHSNLRRLSAHSQHLNKINNKMNNAVVQMGAFLESDALRSSSAKWVALSVGHHDLENSLRSSTAVHTWLFDRLGDDTTFSFNETSHLSHLKDALLRPSELFLGSLAQFSQLQSLMLVGAGGGFYRGKSPLRFKFGHV